MMVYRVEDEHGEGPYNGPHRFGAILWEAHQLDAAGRDPEDMIPPPVWDIPGFQHSRKWRFGFESEEQLGLWFGLHAKTLLRHDFKIARYEVPETDVMRGARQVAFVAEKAKRIDRIPLA